MAAELGSGELRIRLLVAGGAGIILGLPYRKRPGGVRTHYLVTLGAALFRTSGANLVGAAPAKTLRIIQGVASGIGFVGAGAQGPPSQTCHAGASRASKQALSGKGCAVAVSWASLMSERVRATPLK
ncbi:MgtC/SapB family protein [Myxococcus qinghaiensis]|uniref:MgtC/SapB family protein n=1 Tax=Myxococcus qinghaiensis TaxID=2906758 RepID=UPI0020A740E3|nr:MgtC/SapB family protein [Myxococcus qinghaiensis]MCP3165516.1 MgtC/SapB family protein [Myxococcus qinghaiensis]